MTQSIQSSASKGVLKLGRKIDFNGHDIRILSTRPFFLNGIRLMGNMTLSMPHLRKQYFPQEEITLEKILVAAEKTLEDYVSVYGSRVVGSFDIDKEPYDEMTLKHFVEVLLKTRPVIRRKRVRYSSACRPS